MARKGPDPKQPVRTRAQVEQLIERIGGAAPDWWDSVKLNYPKTLDMSWPIKPVGNWNANRNVGQYIWDRINPNPRRWQEGIKLVHHLLIRNQKDPAKVTRTMNSLGGMFYNLMRDWARAAFWWQRCADRGGRINHVRLAHCYWRLGNKEMAMEILRYFREDKTGNGAIIKLWADMGDYDRAIRLATNKAQSGMPDVGYLAAGDTCRMAGRYKQALGFYQKVLKVKPVDKRKDAIQKNIHRAQASIQAITIYDALDLTQVSDGAYQGHSIAYAGELYVEVKIQKGRIGTVKVTKHQEKQFYTAISDTTSQIVAKQGVKGVNAVTGATITSEAIINATAKAIATGLTKNTLSN